MTDDELYDQELGDLRVVEYARAKSSEYNFQRYILTDDPELARLYDMLRGARYSPDGKEEYIMEEERVMNESGARFYVQMLFFVKNAKLSNHDDERIARKMRRISRSLVRSVYENMEVYEIKYEKVSLFIRTFLDYIEDVYYRSYLGAEQERLGTTQKLISEERSNLQPVNSEQVQEKKRSVKDYLPF